ncbi:Scr1 family TA system antitoxin-like transcriptional regulator [Micromonospora viridifaciens]|uniref:Scr1 family TA system antitoxin-like transcriptional regulator n=1 Tax=Micromonospora viridifaciens TaxID=1881 RepID=UPI0012FD9B2B|nr:Scr1 family TA system antitoxin-like transcriptional regulator [Micromonospora viridifaciens]
MKGRVQGLCRASCDHERCRREGWARHAVPPQLIAVIDEVVLRRLVGDRAVMAGLIREAARTWS